MRTRCGEVRRRGTMRLGEGCQTGVGRASQVQVTETYLPLGASLVEQWLRIRLPMQGTWVRALVRHDSHMPRSN